jgi:hypothetical protein
MKKLLLILLMFLSVGAFAQRKKHAKKKARHTTRHRASERNMEEDVAEEETSTYPFFSVDSVTKKLVLKDPPREEDRPLVLINGDIYTGRLADIKRGNILDVSVIKKKGAKMMYGPKAAAGALIIKTRQPLPADLPATLLPPPKPIARQKPFMLNEELTYGQLANIDTATILKIDTLIQPKTAGAKENDTLVNVTTKKYGTKFYQWKFGTLSRVYKAYIRAHHGNDSKVVYILPDGTQLTGDDKLKLFEQAKADIKSVSFTGPHGTRNNRTPATLTIEPNQPAN